MEQETRDQIGVTEDDRPIAMRRKRRFSNGLRVPTDNSPRVASHHDSNVTTAGTPVTAATPQKAKKRVRFSDPGPEIIPLSSTGLTPHIRRTTLAKTPRSSSSAHAQVESPRGRLSLPGLSSGSSLATEEVQFAPLRQVLDERVQRRLRRNNLSEEVNHIEADLRQVSKRRRNAAILDDDTALARQLGTEVIESACNEERGRVRELEEELKGLKEELRQRSVTAEPSFTSDQTEDTVLLDQTPFEETAKKDDISMVTTDLDGNLPNSECEANMSLAQSAATQASIPDPAQVAREDEISRLNTTLATQISHFTSARLSLEHLFPGETALPLTTSDPQPILNAMISRLHSLKILVISTDSALSAKQTQESNLRGQFNAVLQQLDRARKHAEELDASKKNIMKVAENDMASLEKNLDEKERSIRKLQDALNTYRDEVSSLEALVIRLEKEHADVVTGLKAEMESTVSHVRAGMDEAVADLECKIEAETKGRRAGEIECVERGERLKVLEELHKELRGSMHDKQVLVRELERELEEERKKHEQETGILNVRTGQLSSALADAKAEIQKLEGERVRLVKRVEEERDHSVRTVERMKTEMETCSKTVSKVEESHLKDMQSRGGEALEKQGLLTPVSAVKFRDAESYSGQIEVKRGKGKRKKRPDSGIGIGIGIGILEEDEYEDQMEELEELDQ